jgi:aminopeptidase N
MLLRLWDIVRHNFVAEIKPMIDVCLLRQVAVVVALAGVLAACQPDETDAGVAEIRSEARKNVDALDYQSAKTRAERISNVEYELYIDVHGQPDVFSGVATIRFALTDAARDLTLDFGGGSVIQLSVNGDATKPVYNDFFITLPSSGLVAGGNVVVVKYEHPYSKDGTGLHRFVDPEDGLTYLYTYLWPYYANRLFPSFDQPNLKARISMSVLAPENWTVASMAEGVPEPTDDGAVLWRFAASPKMSTYVFSLHAGPYEVWEDQAGDIPVRLMARRSLAEFVAVDEWFDVTKRGLEYYGEYFDIPYPFGKYDQLIVPDFNIGAMENIAAVAFSERYVQRQESDREQRESRAGTILHEMAHMWFGNLVTHDWWNGLWLNESFATQMSAMATIETTEFTDKWHGFFTDAKRVAYGRDSRVTTHPIEMPIESTADFFIVFDAITYQKGSSVLKQLAHYVGEDNYRDGVSSYLKEHSYGTTELGDFIGHQARTAGVDLSQWSEQWLYKAGFNTLRAGVECNQDGLQWLFLQQHAPDGHPYLRRHQIDVALYDSNDDGSPSIAKVFPVTVEGINTSVEVLDAMPCPATVNPNHDDWAYAQIELRDEDVAYLVSQLGNIPEPLTRSIFLGALYDRAMAGEMSLEEYAGHAMRLARSEENTRVQQQISSSLMTTVDMMQRLRPETDQALARLLPEIERQASLSAAASTDGDLKRMWFNTFLGTVSSRSGLAIVRSLLDGSDEIPGVPISADMRWTLLTILAVHGAEDIDELLAVESELDKTDFGAKSLLTATAAKPDKATKAAYLAELRNSETLTGLARQRAVMAVMFPANQTSLQLELLDDVLDALPALSDSTDPYFLSSYTAVLLSPMCRRESSEKMQNALDQYAGRLNNTSLRFLREAHQADRECLALRGLQSRDTDR